VSFEKKCFLQKLEESQTQNLLDLKQLEDFYRCQIGESQVKIQMLQRDIIDVQSSLAKVTFS
jgi:hypothetical protein